MRCNSCFDSIRQFELPRIVRVRHNLYLACFPLMKLLPARFMLDRAEDRGDLLPGGSIVETTSGTFGLALARLAAARGYRLKLVSDPAIDDYLAACLASLGAEVEIMTKPLGQYNYQQARLDRLQQLIETHRDAFCPRQYDNPDNPLAYGRVSEHFVEHLGLVDCLVGTVGSGGSMSGTARFLRQVFPGLHVIGVDTANSILFGQPDGKRQLRGLGNSIMPRNLDHRQFDEIHWVTAREAFRSTRALHRATGLFVGPTSGAGFKVADWWARANPDRITMVLLPDEGHRYAQTVYNDAWLSRIPDWTMSVATEPIQVDVPDDVRSSWSCFPWQRRSLDEVSSARGGSRHERSHDSLRRKRLHRRRTALI